MMLMHRNDSRQRAPMCLSRALIVAMATASAALGQLAPPADPPSAGDRAAPPAAVRPSMETRIYQQLYHTRVDLDFHGAPARAVIDFLTQRMNVNVIVHYATVANPDGIDPEAPIHLMVSDLTTLDALTFVLEQAATLDACDWQVRRGVLEIGPKSRLAAPAKQEIVVYPIDDMLFEAVRHRGARSISLDHRGGSYGSGYGGSGYGYGGRGGRFGSGGGSIPGSGGGSYSPPGQDPRFEERTPRAELANELIETIVTAVEPQGWFRNGGDWAEIRLQENMLVVRAPGFIHRRLAGVPKVDPPASTPPAAKTPTPAATP